MQALTTAQVLSALLATYCPDLAECERGPYLLRAFCACAHNVYDVHQYRRPSHSGIAESGERADML